MVRVDRVGRCEGGFERRMGGWDGVVQASCEIIDFWVFFCCRSRSQFRFLVFHSLYRMVDHGGLIALSDYISKLRKVYVCVCNFRHTALIG